MNTALPALYVLRHGECEHNVAKVVAGRSDTPLTARGREQSRQGGLLLGALLKDPSAIDFVSSSAPRARTTLELVVAAAAFRGVTCKADERLVENDFGAWTGRPGEQAWGFRSAELERTKADPFTWRWPGGESRADIVARIRSFLGDVRRDTVVVAHRWPVVVLRGLALGLPERGIWDFEAKNAAVIEIRDGREYHHGQ